MSYYKRFKEEYGNRVIFLTIFAFFVVLISLTLAFYLEPKVLWQKVSIAALAEIGFAGLISVFIILTIDRHEKYKTAKEYEQHTKRILSGGLARALTDLNLPTSISESLKTLLGDKPVVKTYHKTIINLTYEDEKACLQEYHEYAARNITYGEVNYIIPIFANSVINGSYYARVFKRGASNDWQEVNSSKTFDQDGTSFTHKDKFEISLVEGEEFKFISTVNLSKAVSDSHIWTNLVNAENFELNVEFDNKKFSAGGRIISPIDNEIRNPENTTGAFDLFHRRAFLAGGSYYIFWNIKREFK